MNITSFLPLKVRAALRPWKHTLRDEWAEWIFGLDPQRIARWNQEWSTCHDFEARFAFAQRWFNISQIPSEIKALIDLVAIRDPQVVGEIGTYASGNSFLFTQSLPTLQHFIAVDLRVINRAKLRHFARPNLLIKTINGFSAAVPTLDQVRSSLHGRKFDFVFIDGDHEYAGVKADFLAYAQLTKAGGLIAFHDIVSDQHKQAESGAQFYAGQVYRLWAQLKRRFRTWEFIDNPKQYGAGIGVLELDSDNVSKLAEIGRLQVNDV